jgi:hypothetical protein
VLRLVSKSCEPAKIVRSTDASGLTFELPDVQSVVSVQSNYFWSMPPGQGGQHERKGRVQFSIFNLALGKRNSVAHCIANKEKLSKM